MYNIIAMSLNIELKEKLEEIIKRKEILSSYIMELPKGHINILNRSNKGYYYLTYREGKKIINKYIGVVGKANIDDILKMISDRQQYKEELKQLIQEEKLLRRIVK